MLVMSEDFVPYELAVKLKEKGFREECLCHYIGNDLFYNIESPIANKQLWFSHNKFDNIWHRDNYDAPTISQALKWLRERKKIHICISYSDNINAMWEYEVILLEGALYQNANDGYMSYEEAALAGIEHVLDNLI